jgi:hypothetical protein
MFSECRSPRTGERNFGKNSDFTDTMVDTMVDCCLDKLKRKSTEWKKSGIAGFLYGDVAK